MKTKQAVEEFLMVAVVVAIVLPICAYIGSRDPGPTPPKLAKFVPKPPSCCGDSICLMMEHHQ